MMRTHRRTASGLLALIFGSTLLMAGCVAVGTPGNFRITSPFQTTTNPQDTVVQPQVSRGIELPQSNVLEYADAITQVYERVSPAVVNISVSAQARDQFGRVQQQQGTGSGFIVDKQGNIVTNQHVTDGATRLDVTLADEMTYAAVVVATDPASDLAVIRLQAPADVLATLTTVSLGDSSQLKVGNAVVAIGNPFGLERSASTGIVSSVGRTRPGVTQRLITDMIQTDAAINPGNSGGPLLNLKGEVIGINEQIEAPGGANAGVGFSIPVNTLKRFLPELIAGKQPQHAWIGIAGSPLTPTLAEQLKAPVKQGILVAQAVRNGPAAQAGFRSATDPSSADIVTQVDGQSVRNVEDLASVVERHNPNDVVKVTFIRDGKTQTVDVTLGVWQATSAAAR
jgi:S1-C subfamily serine protease